MYEKFQIKVTGSIFFVSWIRKKPVRALEFMEDGTKNIFLIFSLSWFFTMVLFNVQFTYPQNRILKVLCLLVLALNVTLNFIIIYYLVVNYKNINDLNTKFYLTALKSLTLAQRTSAGCMIMFYNDLLYI